VLWSYNWVQMKVQMKIGVQYASLSTFTALCVTLSGMTLLLT
jgi:hypothetical protein